MRKRSPHYQALVSPRLCRGHGTASRPRSPPAQSPSWAQQLSVRRRSKIPDEAYVLKVLAPGGWAEIQENAPGVPRKPNGEVNHELQQLKNFRVVLEDFSAVGLDLAVPGKLPGWFRDSGFVDIRNFTFKFPITKPLPTQTESKSEREAAEFLYEYHQKYILPMMGTVLDKLSRTLRGEEATNEGSRSFSEWQSQAAAELGTYVDFTIVVGQKPLQ